MFRSAIVTILCSFPLAAVAVGGDDAPKPTETTTVCTGGTIWDSTSQSCVEPRESRLDDDTLYGAVRELAFAGRLAEAQHVLAVMADQADDKVLTYWGFTHRKLGDTALGMSFYRQALARNPDNILARSYMGQAHAEAGDIDAARAQLTEIRRRGGRESWAELALEMSIATGRGYAY
jgi:tetratricopeptide (TPR) repeat protein